MPVKARTIRTATRTTQASEPRRKPNSAIDRSFFAVIVPLLVELLDPVEIPGLNERDVHLPLIVGTTEAGSGNPRKLSSVLGYTWQLILFAFRCLRKPSIAPLGNSKTPAFSSITFSSGFFTVAPSTPPTVGGLYCRHDYPLLPGA